MSEAPVIGVAVAVALVVAHHQGAPPLLTLLTALAAGVLYAALARRVG